MPKRRKQKLGWKASGGKNESALVAEVEKEIGVGLVEIRDASVPGNVENKFHRFAIVALVLLVTFWGFWVVMNTPPKIDEPYHYWQITMFIEGDWSMLKVDDAEYPFFAMLPGYHAVMACLFGTLQVADPLAMRVFSTACGLGTFMLALSISRRVEGRANFLRAAQVYFSPFAFPFYFLLYSDIFSLLTVFALLLAYVSGSRLGTALSSVGILLVRQSQIVLIPLLMALATKDAFLKSDQPLRRRVIASAQAVFPFAPAILLFAIFLVWNDGRVPLCRPHLQQTSLLGWNALLFLSLASIWMAPVQLAIATECYRFVTRNRVLSLIVFLAVIVLISRLSIEDPRNRISHFVELLRNYLMHYSIGSLGGYLLFAATTLWALLSILVSKWTHPCGNLLLAVIALSMGPIMLVEPRYFIVATSWYLLFRRHQSTAVEQIQLIWMSVIAISLHWFQSTTIYLM